MTTPLPPLDIFSKAGEITNPGPWLDVNPCAQRCGASTFGTQRLHNAVIFDLGRRCFQYFTKYFRTVANKSPPTPSDHPSRPSMDPLRDSILATIRQAPTTHSQAKDRALVGDNYRCQLTGIFDSKSYRNSPATREAAAANPAAGLGSTECHHILQFIGQQTDNPRVLETVSFTVYRAEYII
ncbi:unnamed protein product [Rhizoctonia solani]|uniref:HNH nuclease domain-containing protein n=1 Tax=Rhizoctonia solani TaxID=456999 RepID=A0A8H3HTH6_9AGAM|nr:unnamed protein product [Rhizoctonia solani]